MHHKKRCLPSASVPRELQSSSGDPRAPFPSGRPPPRRVPRAVQERSQPRRCSWHPRDPVAGGDRGQQSPASPAPGGARQLNPGVVPLRLSSRHPPPLPQQALASSRLDTTLGVSGKRSDAQFRNRTVLSLLLFLSPRKHQPSPVLFYFFYFFPQPDLHEAFQHAELSPSRRVPAGEPGAPRARAGRGRARDQTFGNPRRRMGAAADTMLRNPR